MKNRSILLLSGLLIGLAFSVLLVRLTSLERENARQREQIAVMRKTATQARKAFYYMESYRSCIRPGMDDEWSHITRKHAEAELKANSKNLDAAIQTLENISKEK